MMAWSGGIEPPALSRNSNYYYQKPL